MNQLGVLRHLGTIIISVVPQNGCHSKTVVRENTASTSGLAFAVAKIVPPFLDRFLISPKRQGQNLASIRQTLKTLDRDKAID
jgi:hypothetical protein